MAEKQIIILKEINENLKELNQKIDQLIKLQQNSRSIPSGVSRLPGMILQPIDAIALLNLPDRLRKVASLMINLNRVTAEDVAKEMGVTRESAVVRLNELVRLGYLGKERGQKEKGESARKTYFYTIEQEENNSEDSD